ncbi:hypothetical protein VOLCADRAFT_57321 [Volvox carteri f. nagariensis]|uniref:SOUL heme-binding protein n=1 Tax=Volvox carteri f. nagariensis TaxID=3068 RepID=D8TMZ5_VOLCA|nr:uncharacterized protein VOLCADRAFT_57321 [Volvox carteri f. nagariensis]EFJ51339.1 hypothetical protein VOLCADRAFT_57321 [Volvox carteri f. nagariensis]|eukprot:XP_002947806.1 hypothetical protein VOLCADRAFT_57321 [Volvox carteri f. nagariensis]
MSSIFGSITVETPKYSVVKALAGASGAELRKYCPQVRAEVLYDIAPNHGIMDGLNAPFRALAGRVCKRAVPCLLQSAQVAMTAPVVMQTGATEGPSEKIAMTAPVVMQTGTTEAAGASEGPAGGNKRVMSFIMPSQYKSVVDLPAPKDPRVRLFEVPERTFAAIRFHGRMTQAVAKVKEQELRAAAAKADVKLSDEPHAVQYCAYNPPWCLPWFATNDILIPVAE